jgi:hypothetical protein
METVPAPVPPASGTQVLSAMAAASGPAPAAVIHLEKTISGHHAPISVIELRPPTFGDWLDIGEIQAYVITDTQAMSRGQPIATRVEHRLEAIGRWFQALSGQPMAVLTQMSLADARRVYTAIARLVGTIDGGNSGTSQPSSGSSAA